MPNREAEQSLAADGAIASFSSNLFPSALNADRAPQLKAGVRRFLVKLEGNDTHTRIANPDYRDWP